MTTETANWVGQVLSGDRYQVIAKLGEGGMGFVYRARDRHLGCDVVIKVPRPAVIQEPEFAARFAHEIRSLVRLVHPHVVKISDVGDHDKAPFAVMQYLPGGSLRDRQQPRPDGNCRPQPAEELSSWLDGVATALDFIHGQHYVHRDVKPENILFDAHGNVYLSDFGVAKVVAGAAEHERKTVLTNAGMVLGTAPYMAPEVLLGQAYDGRADQYALGVTVYQMLSGSLPFDGPTPAAIMLQQSIKTAPALHERLPKLSKAVSMVVQKAMHREPAQRYPSCKAFAEALLAAALDQPLPGRTQAPRGRPAAPPTQPAATPGKVTCPKCRKPFRLPPMGQGQRVRCPSCKTAFAPPRETSLPTQPDSMSNLNRGNQSHTETSRVAPSSQTIALPQRSPGGRPWSRALGRLRQVHGFGWLQQFSDVALFGGIMVVIVLSGLVGWLLLRPSASRQEVAAANTPKATTQETHTRRETESKTDTSAGPKQDLVKAKIGEVLTVPIDANLRVDYGISVNYTFGVVAFQQKGGKTEPLNLTFDVDGRTNTTGIKVDGKTYTFGNSKQGVLRGGGKVHPDPSKEKFGGYAKTWDVIPAEDGGPIRFTQIVEKVPSAQPVGALAGEKARVVDTILICYRFENTDRRPHKVELRVIVDTCIGKNDGVPFAAPGVPYLITTKQDWYTSDIPSFLQVLERPNLKDPGTIAQMTLKVGGKVEPPQRVSLTKYQVEVRKVDEKTTNYSWPWNVPVKNMENDSAVVLYWPEQALPPGETREVGFAYGLGYIASSESRARLALAVGGSFSPREVFHVLAYVKSPLPGETLKLDLPAGLELVEGNLQAPVSVPSVESGVGYSTQSWTVRGERPGHYNLRVTSSLGDRSQSLPVTIYWPGDGRPPAAVAKKE